MEGADHVLAREAKPLGDALGDVLRRDGIELMVRGDPRLRRPYLVATTPNAPAAARDLATWLRGADTQAWIGTFGKGRYDDASLFFSVEVR